MKHFFQSILDDIKSNIPKRFNDLQFDVETNNDNNRCSITVAVADDYSFGAEYHPVLTIHVEIGDKSMFCKLFAHKWKGDFLPNNHFSKCVSNIRFENKISTWIENIVASSFSNVSTKGQ